MILAAGITGIGVLEQQRIMVNLQDFVSLDTVEEIAGDMMNDNDGTFICKCENPNFDPNAVFPSLDAIEFHQMFCEFGVGERNFDSATLCTWETSLDEYGGYTALYGEGCGVGYWKNHVTHILKRLPSGSTEWVEELDWPTGYNSNYLYNDIFQTNLALPVGPSDGDDIVKGRHDVATENQNDRQQQSRYSTKGEVSTPSLEEALNARGGGVNLLARETVAAMLNAAHEDIDYHYDIPEIMDMTQEAISSGDYTYATIEFKQYNSAGADGICSD